MGARAIASGRRLMAESKLLNQRTIPLEFRALHVIEEPAALTDHLEEAPTTMIVLLVRAKMIGEVVDPLRQQRDLQLR